MSVLEDALKEIRSAEAIMGETLSIAKDNKLYISAVRKANSILAMLLSEALSGKDFEKLRKLSEKHGKKKEISARFPKYSDEVKKGTDAYSKSMMILKNYNESSMIFFRKDKLVIAGEKFEIITLSKKEVKEMISVAKKLYSKAYEDKKWKKS